MLDDIKNKLLHFTTHGNIAEDFAAAKKAKIAKLRTVTRLCFYAHILAAAGCIAAVIALGVSGAALAAVIAGAVSAAAIAFLSAGGGTSEKTVLCIMDIAYVVVSFAAGITSEKGGAFYICGTIMIFAALFAIAAFIAAYFRAFLESFPAKDLKREHYTRLPSLAPDKPVGDEDTPAAVPPPPAITEYDIQPPQLVPPPPPRSELRKLSDEYRRIILKIK